MAVAGLQAMDWMGCFSHWCCAVLCHSLCSGCRWGVFTSGRHTAMVNGSKQTHDITWFIPGSPGSQWVEKTGSHWFSAVTCPPSQCRAAARSRTSLHLCPLPSLGKNWSAPKNGLTCLDLWGSALQVLSLKDFNGSCRPHHHVSNEILFQPNGPMAPYNCPITHQKLVFLSLGLHHRRRQRVLLCPGPPLQTEDGMISPTCIINIGDIPLFVHQISNMYSIIIGYIMYPIPPIFDRLDKPGVFPIQNHLEELSTLEYH